jgi:hypothetical protein
MRFHVKASSSAVLVALCSLLMGGCGAGTAPEDSGSSSESHGDDLGGAVSAPGDDTSQQEDTRGMVTLCHVPPGNPANAHTISVGAPAVRAHLHHGDHLGACDGSREPDAGTPPPDAGTPQADGGSTTPDAGSPGPVDGGPTCAGSNEPCSTSSPCCSGLACQASVCVPVIH